MACFMKKVYICSEIKAAKGWPSFINFNIF